MVEEQAGKGYSMEETTNFKIYEMPSSLAMRLVNHAKTHSGNKVWVSIETLLDREDLERRVGLLEERLTKLEGDKNGKI